MSITVPLGGKQDCDKRTCARMVRGRTVRWRTEEETGHRLALTWPSRPLRQPYDSDWSEEASMLTLDKLPLPV